MAMGFDNFNDVVIPNAVQTCQKQYDYPMVMTLADRPYTIVQVNERWENLTGYKATEVVGKRSCTILQGTDTTRKDLDKLMGPVLFKRPSCGMMTNYTKTGRRYRTYITIYPLSTDSNISHYFGLTTFVQWIDAEDPDHKRDGSASNGDSSGRSGSHKRSSESLNGNQSSQPNKQAKTNGSSSSSSDTSADNAIKMVTASQHDNSKQSLSSLTSSISSGSISRESGGSGTDAIVNTESGEAVASSVAVLAPSARAKAAAGVPEKSQKQMSTQDSSGNDSTETGSRKRKLSSSPSQQR
eukprot:scaffold13998_cov234-Alexandrium_tamarense.AAC.4